MIHIDDSMIKVTGSKLAIKAELGSLFRSLMENTSLTKEDCHEMVDMGFLSKEELHDKFMDELARFKKNLEDIRKTVNSEEKEEEEKSKESEDSDKLDELLDKLFGDIL